MAKAYPRAQDPEFCGRSWQDVATLIDTAYEEATKRRFAKFVKSSPMGSLKNTKLVHGYQESIQGKEDERYQP